jgi:chemotaxis protein histidine kinase CheA
MSMQTEVRRLVLRHCATLREEVCQLSRAVTDWDASEGEAGASLEAALFGAHKIRGSSGSMGFGEVSDVAGRLETHLRSVAERGGGRDDGEREAARHLVDDLFLRVSDLAPEQSTLFNRDWTAGFSGPSRTA